MNMDNKAKRQGWETCQWRPDWTSRPIENRRRLRAHEGSWLLPNLTTPHPADPPPVRDGLKNRVIDPANRHPNRHSAAQSELANPRQSLSSAAQIW